MDELAKHTPAWMKRPVTNSVVADHSVLADIALALEDAPESFCQTDAQRFMYLHWDFTCAQD